MSPARTARGAGVAVANCCLHRGLEHLPWKCAQEQSTGRPAKGPGRPDALSQLPRCSAQSRQQGPDFLSYGCWNRVGKKGINIYISFCTSWITKFSWGHCHKPRYCQDKLSGFKYFLRCWFFKKPPEPLNTCLTWRLWVTSFKSTFSAGFSASYYLSQWFMNQT